MFEVVDRKSTTGFPVPHDGIVVSLRRLPNANEYYLVAKIGAALIAKLGWKSENSIEVAWGHGTHDGQLRLRRAARRTGFVIRHGRYGWMIGLGSRPDVFTKKKPDDRSAMFEVLNEERSGHTSVVITLPKTFLVRPTIATLATG